MCGIAGWLGTLPDTEGAAQRLIQALHHRGPDAHGLRSWPEATLVHTRLSIIDLSPTGAQPMANEDGTIWVIFNGEIYNHRELRRELEVRGHVFRGYSDTEVLPHLYEEEGTGFVTKLRGMFAVAIYDARAHTLVLTRDRFGIKPLFYVPMRDHLIFASELGALLGLPGVDYRPDRQAIFDFAALGFIPAPETFYSGIRALQPGDVLEAQIADHSISWKTWSYHRWAIAPDPTLTLEEAANRADALVMEATRRQLESDVPLGALLSGGIDSSLVSAAAQAALNGELRTFNVRFPERDYDETWAALAVAKHIGSCHEILDIEDMLGTWDYVTSLLLHAGQPFADTSMFAVNAVCRLMRRYVTVALSGDGGDEGFGGYQLYWRLARMARWQRLPAPVWRGASAVLNCLRPFGIVLDHFATRFQALAGADNTAVLQQSLCWLSAEEHRRLCRDRDLLPIRRMFEAQWEYRMPPRASRLEWLSAQATEINTRLLLPNDFLFKVDTASMRESLEIRVPMLDEELFSFGLSLPHHLKVVHRTCKRVLREVAKHRLPAAVADKPKKGFGIPVDSWVDADFKARLRENLLGPSSRLPEFFQPEVYRPMVEAFCQGTAFPGVSRQSLYQRVIILLSVHLALDQVSSKPPLADSHKSYARR